MNMSHQTPTKSTTEDKHDTLFDCLSVDAIPLPSQAQDVDLPRSSTKPFALCCVIENALTPEECKAIIARAQAKGFEPALLNVGGGRQVYAPDTRNSERCVIDDEVFAEQVFKRIRHLLPETHKQYQSTYPVAGLNERMRILRYQPGQDFKPHCDGSFFRPDGSQGSFWTVMIYLNNGGNDNDFQGGSTLFHARDGTETVAVVPKAGSVLVFDHDLYHEGEQVMRGTKYALRTDVMFQTRPSPPSSSS